MFSFNPLKSCFRPMPHEWALKPEDAERTGIAADVGAALAALAHALKRF
jgi:hypothetical protein